MSTNSFRKASNHSKSSKTRTSLESKLSHPSIYNSLNDYRAMNVYAEVRGKYARPPPPFKPSTSTSVLNTQENPVVSRPSTAGSYRPKSQQRAITPGAYSKNEPKLEDITPVMSKDIPDDLASHRSLPFENGGIRYRKSGKNSEFRSRSSNRNGIRFVEEKKITDIQTAKQETIDQNQIEGSSSVDSENLEEKVDDLVENKEVQDTVSITSWVTTSSHRRYIEELEDMLRAEKLRRIRAEEELKKVANSRPSTREVKHN